MKNRRYVPGMSKDGRFVWINEATGRPDRNYAPLVWLLIVGALVAFWGGLYWIIFR